MNNYPAERRFAGKRYKNEKKTVISKGGY